MKKESKIKVSIIAPCYNAEKYLPRCLDSLVNQTLKDIEVICINDGSTDKTLKILKDYQKKYSVLKIIDKKNQGTFLARMDGIKQAKGEYLCFVDSDDHISLEYAEKLYNSVKENNSDIAVCGYERIDMDTNKVLAREMCKKRRNIDLNEDNDLGLILEVNSSLWNKIYKADLFKKMHILKGNPGPLEDVTIQQLLYLNTKRISFIDESLYYYYVRSDSLIHTIKDEYVDTAYRLLKEIKEIYIKENPKMLDYLSATAFLNFGISLMYRLSSEKKKVFNKKLKRNTKYLNENFPGWKKNKYITLKFIHKNKGVNRKLWIVKKFYDFHMFKLFLAVYKFTLKTFKIDIKW